MADNKVTYAIVVEGEASGAALTAAQALKKLDAQIAADTKSLAAMQKAMRNMQAGSSVNVDSFRKLQSQMSAAKDRIAQAQSKVVDLGGSFAQSGKAAGKGLTEKLKALTEQAQQMPGPMGGLAGRLSAVRAALGGGAIALGIAAIAAALVALAVGAIAATRAMYNYGIAQADARRSELLRLEGLTKMRFFFQRIPGNAKEMQNAIDQVAAKTPVAREQVAKYSEQLYRMGLRGNALSKTLEGVAIKSAVQGEEAANAFAGWAAGAALTGRSVDKLVDRVKNRLGGIAAKQMESLTVQTMKQKEAQDALFGGLDIDSWLKAWKGVRDLLTQATASGRALKFLVTNILQPLIDTSAKSAPLMKRFFQGIIIATLQVVIVVLTLRNWFKKTFGDSSLFGPSEDFFVLMGELVATGAIATLVVFVGALAGAFVSMTAPMAAVVYGLFKLGEALFNMVNFVAKHDWTEIIGAIGNAMLDGLSFLLKPFTALGGLMVDGLIAGLDVGPLVEHMKTMATDALQGFAAKLGIFSPSRAFMKVGAEIPAGLVQGVEAGAPEAQQATQNMVDATAPELGSRGAAGGALDGRAPAAAAMKGGTTVTIEQVVVQATSDKPEQLAIDFRRELEKVLEGFAFELGAPEPA